jgi:hypothetical protein
VLSLSDTSLALRYPMTTSFAQGIDGAGQQGCTEETLIIQGVCAHMQCFAMSVAAARSALTFTLIRPKEQKEEKVIHPCMHAYRASFPSAMLQFSALHLSPPKLVIGWEHFTSRVDQFICVPLHLRPVIY